MDFRERMKYMFQFSTFAFFVIPMVVITIMYVLIGVRLWKSQMAVDEKKNKSAAEAASKARKAVLKMLGKSLQCGKCNWEQYLESESKSDLTPFYRGLSD